MRYFLLFCVFFIGCADPQMEYGEIDQGWALIIAKSQPEAAAQRHIVVLESLEHIYVVDNEKVWKEFNVEDAAQVEFQRTYMVIPDGRKYLYNYYLKKIGQIELWPKH